ncbi:MAG: hypothetical protein IPH51_22350 [Rubrivivax sp.]|nr:hypothetical protein [Rubrivivax sp.]
MWSDLPSELGPEPWGEARPQWRCDPAVTGPVRPRAQTLMQALMQRMPRCTGARKNGVLNQGEPQCDRASSCCCCRCWARCCRRPRRRAICMSTGTAAASPAMAIRRPLRAAPCASSKAGCSVGTMSPTCRSFCTTITWRTIWSRRSARC